MTQHNHIRQFRRSAAVLSHDAANGWPATNATAHAVRIADPGAAVEHRTDADDAPAALGTDPERFQPSTPRSTAAAIPVLPNFS